MNKLQNFNFNNNYIRSVKIDNNNWFLAKDVAKALGQSNTYRAVLINVSKRNTRILKWRNMSNSFKTKLWGKNDYSNKVFINEPGLYSVTFHNKILFHDWVINKILPSVNHNINFKSIEQYLNNHDTILTIYIKHKNTQQSKIQKHSIKNKDNFYKNSKSSRGAILVGDMAKLLKKNGINTGQNRLFKWLRNNHYLSSRHGLDWNTPTQRSLDRNIISLKERSKNFLDGSKFIFKTPLITGKGQQYFYEKLIKKVNNK